MTYIGVRPPKCNGGSFIPLNLPPKTRLARHQEREITLKRESYPLLSNRPTSATTDRAAQGTGTGRRAFLAGAADKRVEHVGRQGKKVKARRAPPGAAVGDR